jgi:hypothetical protein
MREIGEGVRGRDENRLILSALLILESEGRGSFFAGRGGRTSGLFSLSALSSSSSGGVGVKEMRRMSRPDWLPRFSLCRKGSRIVGGGTSDERIIPISSIACPTVATRSSIDSWRGRGTIV